MNNNNIHASIMPKDVRIYYEDNMPYLEYTGEITANDGTKTEVRLPKISLVYNVIEDNSEYYDQYAYGIHGEKLYFTRVKLSQNVIIKNDKWYDMQIVEREMTKKQIEKELGYNVKIVED